MENNQLDTFLLEDYDDTKSVFDDLKLKNTNRGTVNEFFKNNPKHYVGVKISILAVLKALRHAISGGNIEIMGLLTGKIKGNWFYVSDSFALPVEGTETRVSAGNQANEFMINYSTLSEDGFINNGNNNVVGWYHSHPGYSCWLSGIDVETQQMYQSIQDPMIAIVIDPHKSITTGKIDIGAFRTYPDGYIDQGDEMAANVPLSKVEDFGLHWRKYYPLKVEIYKTEQDEHLIHLLKQQLWNQALSINLPLTCRTHINSTLQDTSTRLFNQCNADMCTSHKNKVQILSLLESNKTKYEKKNANQRNATESTMIPVTAEDCNLMTVQNQIKQTIRETVEFNMSGALPASVEFGAAVTASAKPKKENEKLMDAVKAFSADATQISAVEKLKFSVFKNLQEPLIKSTNNSCVVKSKAHVEIEPHGIAHPPL